MMHAVSKGREDPGPQLPETRFHILPCNFTIFKLPNHEVESAENIIKED